ncbi:hypothetical protein [Natrinema versiforme]|uniref:Uncharacterized protein n=1 Tax=Natrinema versiforme JCM 10478 TaxID=1227496 RepID=L9YES7_9EURY|nr:hypothetical protein [Natrinema versiforme]ELY71448.1 hypothetical protein C489_00731 [Natrinema versiforme JCM 10478]
MTSRRHLLRRGIGLAAAGSVAGLAGCNDTTARDTESETDGGPTSYTEWLFDPSNRDLTDVQFGYTDVAGLLETDAFAKADAMRDAYRDVFGERFDIESVAYSLTVDRLFVLSGEFDGSTIAADRGLEDDGRYGEFDVYTGAPGGFAFAATDEYLVAATDPAGRERGPQAALESAIDAANGDGDRFVDENDEFSRLVAELPPGAIVSGSVARETEVEIGGTDPRVGVGSSQRFAGDRLTTVGVIRYTDEAAADAADLEVAADDFPGERADLVAIEREGRTVTVTFDTAPADVTLNLP